MIDNALLAKKKGKNWCWEISASRWQPPKHTGKKETLAAGLGVLQALVIDLDRRVAKE